MSIRRGDLRLRRIGARDRQGRALAAGRAPGRLLRAAPGWPAGAALGLRCDEGRLGDQGHRGRRRGGLGAHRARAHRPAGSGRCDLVAARPCDARSARDEFATEVDCPARGSRRNAERVQMRSLPCCDAWLEESAPEEPWPDCKLPGSRCPPCWSWRPDWSCWAPPSWAPSRPCRTD